MKKIGIADTTFARSDMGKLAEKTLKDSGREVKVQRYTVPGVKDLPLAAKKLLEEENCDLVIALGMPGAAEIDKTCAHESSLGLINVQLQTNKHIVEVFIHEDEASNEKELSSTVKDRTIKHCKNALDILFNPTALTKRAGTSQRQGSRNAPYFEP